MRRTAKLGISATLALSLLVTPAVRGQDDPFSSGVKSPPQGTSLRDPDEEVAPPPTPTPARINMEVIEKSVEPNVPSPARDETLPPPGKGEEPLRWEAELAESSFSLVKNNASLNRILTAYERLVEQRCFTGLVTKLVYEGNPQDPACLRFIERLLELHPRNAIGTCARDGLESTTCINTDATVTYGRKNLEGQGDIGQILDNKLEKSREDAGTVSRYESEISQLIQSSSSFPVTEADKEFQKKAQERILELRKLVIRLACRDVQMDLAAPDPMKAKDQKFGDIEQLLTTRPKKVKTPTPTPGPEKNALEAFQKTGPTPTPTPLAANRVRRFSNSCIAHAEEVLKQEKDSAIATCALYGQTSPRCVRALRKERGKKKAEPTAKPDGTAPVVKKEFDTF